MPNFFEDSDWTSSSPSPPEVVSDHFVAEDPSLSGPNPMLTPRREEEDDDEEEERGEVHAVGAARGLAGAAKASTTTGVDHDDEEMARAVAAIAASRGWHFAGALTEASISSNWGSQMI